MIEYSLVAILLVIVVMASLASCGWDIYEMRNREVWWWTGILSVEISMLDNPWMAGLLAIFVVGLFQIGRSWFLLHTVIMPTAGLAGAYLICARSVEPWMLIPVLWAMGTVGSALGAWGLFSYWKGEKFTINWLEQGWCGHWGIYDHHMPEAPYLCGQGNMMHLASMSSLCVAAVCGLLWLGQWSAFGLLPLCLAPLVLAQLPNVYTKFHPHQGILHVFTLACAVFLLLWPWPTLGTVAVLGTGFLVYAKPWAIDHWDWWDSGRLSYWKDVVRYIWWPRALRAPGWPGLLRTWQHRLLGFGTGSWFPATVCMANNKKHPSILTNAHNEYLQQLVEHGIVGLVILVGYLADTLWRLSQGGPIGQAGFLIGAVWCSIALVNFPWTYYHEWHPPNATKEEWFGSPSLNALAFVSAVLAEAF